MQNDEIEKKIIKNRGKKPNIENKQLTKKYQN
jgi:hypothetical protein